MVFLNRSWIARGTLVAFATVAAAVFGANGCLVSFPEYQVGDLQAAGGHAGQGGNAGASGADASSGGGGSGGAEGGLAGTGGGTGGGPEGGDGGPSCTNGVTDGDETDTDCGGGTCPKCGVGATCSTAPDCT